jgi:hypothetical protein
MDLKDRIFGPSDKFELEKIPETDKFSLEEILETLARETKEIKAFVFSSPEKKSIPELERSIFLVDDEEKKVKPDLLLYELFENTYYVYLRKKEENNESEHYKQPQKDYGLFIPTGVVVRRVPQSIIGDGVLGRAFIHSNYIEILDSLLGDEYMEVLTHEVLHIMYPEKRELEIRQMTRNYVGNTIYN